MRDLDWIKSNNVDVLTLPRINLGKNEVTLEHQVHIGSERLVLSEGDDMILTCNTSKPVPVLWKWDVSIVCSKLSFDNYIPFWVCHIVNDAVVNANTLLHVCLQVIPCLIH